MKKVGATDLNITIRQRHLMIILSQLRSEGIGKPTLKILQSRLSRSSGIKVAENTIHGDLKEIQTENTFVKDIAAKHYSRLNEQSVHNYVFVQGESLKNYQKNWTMDKTIRKTDEDGTSIEEHQTQELSHPKAEFLRLFMDAEEKIQNTINGKACDISVAMIGEEHRRFLTEYETLKDKAEKAVTS